MKRICLRCRKRPAKFKGADGRYRSDNDHDMCHQCVIAEKQHQRALDLRGEG